MSKMRIGILTFHQSVNNGAVMQAYSLSSRLQKDFPSATVEIIDYRMPKVEKTYSYTIKSYYAHSTLRSFLGKTKKLLIHPKFLKRMQKRTKIFERNLDTLPLSKSKIISDGTQEVFKYIDENYDVLIVGSDAIWNYKFRGFPTAYLPGRQVAACKLSYAASCYGMDFLVQNEGERKAIKEALNEFSFIGVRDKASEDFVKWSGCEVEPVHTCDPTVFLDVNTLPVDENGLHEKMEKRGFDFSKPAIAVMGSPDLFEMIRNFYGKKYQIVALYEYIKDADVNLYDLSPYEWAYAFRFFKLTFTTYFHGTLVSLRNGTPVICIALQTEFAKKHTPKTLDVLTRLGLENWYFESDYKSLNIDLIKQTADDFLQNDYKKQILAAMDNEAKSYTLFKKHLENTIKNMERQKW